MGLDQLSGAKKEAEEGFGDAGKEREEKRQRGQMCLNQEEKAQWGKTILGRRLDNQKKEGGGLIIKTKRKQELDTWEGDVAERESGLKN